MRNGREVNCGGEGFSQMIAYKEGEKEGIGGGGKFLIMIISVDNILNTRRCSQKYLILLSHKRQDKNIYISTLELLGGHFNPDTSF